MKLAPRPKTSQYSRVLFCGSASFARATFHFLQLCKDLGPWKSKDFFPHQSVTINWISISAWVLRYLQSQQVFKRLHIFRMWADLGIFFKYLTLWKDAALALQNRADRRSLANLLVSWPELGNCEIDSTLFFCKTTFIFTREKELSWWQNHFPFVLTMIFLGTKFLMRYTICFATVVLFPAWLRYYDLSSCNLFGHLGLPRVFWHEMCHFPYKHHYYSWDSSTTPGVQKKYSDNLRKKKNRGP